MKKYTEEELSATLGMNIFDPYTEPGKLLSRCAEFCEEMLDLYADDPAYEPEHRAFGALQIAIAMAGTKYEVLRLMAAGKSSEDISQLIQKAVEETEEEHAAQ